MSFLGSLFSQIPVTTKWASERDVKAAKLLGAERGGAGGIVLDELVSSKRGRTRPVVSNDAAPVSPDCPECSGPLIQPTRRGKSAQPLWCGKCERGFDWCALDARLRRELSID
ncbi:hypothetical protein [Burkholderia contaminans]|uniref:hypothetical protein n=1 Tax=Burkholderia contaminans TaxID=488447 RepID=UPI002D7E4560|nr:hypothetical protein [Burkholderia contaminans]